MFSCHPLRPYWSYHGWTKSTSSKCSLVKGDPQKNAAAPVPRYGSLSIHSLLTISTLSSKPPEISALSKSPLQLPSFQPKFFAISSFFHHRICLDIYYIHSASTASISWVPIHHSSLSHYHQDCHCRHILSDCHWDCHRSVQPHPGYYRDIEHIAASPSDLHYHQDCHRSRTISSWLSSRSSAHRSRTIWSSLSLSLSSSLSSRSPLLEHSWPPRPPQPLLSSTARALARPSPGHRWFR